MKKLSIVLLSTTLLLAACGDNEKTESVADNKIAEPDNEKSKYPFPEIEPFGDAELTLKTPSGDSTASNIPILYVEPNSFIVQIGADFANFEGDKLTFVYVDEVFSYSEQYGYLTQTSINLDETNLDTGMHTVAAIQFENDDPSGGEVVNFVEAVFEVKETK